MYSTLLFLHSLGRWAVVGGLVYGIARAYRGWLGNQPFTPLDNTIRHTVATIAHVQLMLGYALYFVSPLLKTFHLRDAEHDPGTLFFGFQHVAAMTVAIVVLTIGAARAKRQPTSTAQFRTMALWFTAALLLILLAIPWPFSPLASRPYFRFPF
ncbi:hypothetical protein J0X19_09045 [Hymenobacter sp. BT186]|uniref:Cytochrome B n=1 Tax=Hymenobacter telluris TaxID=2816474 RepID=A0A939EWW4_9BACT|nr:hypothetical protein [Hymenobacter telluris]MBO0358087.1 hypothetical protein [Hymenobacter telluris]MBW3374114.1 hypothetical protein [Hymenobacter norwichensis]